MKIRLFPECLLVIIWFFEPLAANAADKTFNAETFTLKNGLQVVVVPNHRAPVVTHMIWIKAGAADERPGLSGMAHYLEHLLFKGTEKTAPGEFSKTVRTLGGNDNAFTSQDYTAFHESIAVENLEKVMTMEADRLMSLNPPPEHFASEKQVVLEERRQRTDNDPQARLSEQMLSALYANHPYGAPVIGWMTEIEKYEWKDVKTFYDTWYAPNNAIVVVSGDMTAEKFRPLAEKIYGPLPVREVPRRLRAQVPPAPASALLISRDPAVRQPLLMQIRLAPGYHTAREDSLALDILSEILAGGPSRRLYKSLVVEQKKATSVSLSYNGDALDYGSIWISGTPADGVSVEELGARINMELKKLIANGIAEQELKEAKQTLLDEAVYARDSLQGPAMIIGLALSTGSTLGDVEYWPQNIEAVTLDQVNAAAAKYLNPDQSWIRPPVTGFLLPQEKMSAPEVSP